MASEVLSTETKFTRGPWFVSGTRFRMNGGEWHSINRYDEANKKDENICVVGFDPRTGLGFSDAHLIAAAPDLYEALLAAIPYVRAFAENAPMDEGGSEAIDDLAEFGATLLKARGGSSNEGE